MDPRVGLVATTLPVEGVPELVASYLRPGVHDLGPTVEALHQEITDWLEQMVRGPWAERQWCLLLLPLWVGHLLRCIVPDIVIQYWDAPGYKTRVRLSSPFQYDLLCECVRAWFSRTFRGWKCVPPGGPYHAWISPLSHSWAMSELMRDRLGYKVSWAENVVRVGWDEFGRFRSDFPAMEICPGFDRNRLPRWVEELLRKDSSRKRRRVQ
jgi:hypothetical protein